MSELRPPAPPKRHLLSIRDLDRDDVERILDRARSLAASLDREV
jgi:aspartate carbamoyltransferase catalytic subunit